jgi:hypothetical protein
LTPILLAHVLRTGLVEVVFGHRFEAHRSHFYQYLANVIGWQHLWISTLYMIVQLMVNLLIFYSDWDSVDLLIFILVSGIVFAGLRFAVEGRERLMVGELDNEQINK